MKRILSGIVLLLVSFAAGADETKTSAESTPPVLSVFDFTDNSANEDWAWLSAGIADMLLTDLAVTDLSVVDRSDLEKIFEEYNLALAGITDDTALRMGRLLQADALLTGSYAVNAGTIRLDFRITDTTTGEIRDAGTVSGPPDSVFSLEARLVGEICRVLDVDLPESPGNPGTESLPAARAYYEGLILQRSGQVEEARIRFEDSAELDPLYARPRYSLEESWKLLDDFRKLRRQQEVNTLWRKAEALETRLSADPFITDTDMIMAAYTAGSPTVSTGTNPEDPTLGSCPTPAVCLWNLQITYWEIGNQSREYFDDAITEQATLREVIRLAEQADQAWPEDEWLPEILYWEIFAQRWLEDWQSVKEGCERIFVEWPTFRMAWALEDFYELALTELEG